MAGKIGKLTANQKESIKVEYEELIKTCTGNRAKDILALKYGVGRTSISTYGAGIIPKKYEPLMGKIPNKPSVKTDRLKIMAIKKHQADGIFNSIHVGDSLKLNYKKKSRLQKTFTEDLNIRHGEVFQKTSHLIYIKDSARNYLKQAISASEIETGHIKLEVVV